MKKVPSGITLILVLVGMLTLAFNVQPVKVEAETFIPDYPTMRETMNATEQTVQLVLKTDKHVYVLGETIAIILKNIGDERVEIGGYPAWQILMYPEEEAVYPLIFATLAWSLEPKENDTFMWNQYNQFNDSFCDPGTYVVRDNQGWNLSTYFNVTFLTDLNLDGTVDMKDLSLAASVYGESLGRDRWNPVADINHDGIIDMRDIALVARDFGKTWQ